MKYTVQIKRKNKKTETIIETTEIEKAREAQEKIEKEIKEGKYKGKINVIFKKE